MAYLNENGEWVLGDAVESTTQPEEELRDENGCLPIDPTQPYKPPCFLPSEEDCVSPYVIRQKSRETVSGFVYRSVDTGKRPYVSMTWQYHNGTSYVDTTNYNNMKITSAGAANKPRAKFTTYDDSNGSQETLYGSHYELTVTIPPVLPATVGTTVTTYVNAMNASTTALSASSFVRLPNVDELENYTRNIDGVGGFEPSSITTYFSKQRLEYNIPVDGVSTVTEIEDPTSLRTGPFETIAYEGLTEENNDIGRLEDGVGKVRYNYVTSLWEEL